MTRKLDITTDDITAAYRIAGDEPYAPSVEVELGDEMKIQLIDKDWDGVFEYGFAMDFRDNDEWCEDVDELPEEVVGFLNNLLSERGERVDLNQPFQGATA